MVVIRMNELINELMNVWMRDWLSAALVTSQTRLSTSMLMKVQRSILKCTNMQKYLATWNVAYIQCLDIKQILVLL